METVALVRINHHLRLHAQIPQRVPEFVRLRRGAFAVAVAYHYQRRRLYVLDVLDRRTLRIYGSVVVDRGAEIWQHPLIDGILAVVALPVGDARACHRGAEAVSLRDSPHGHEAAVTPAGDAHAI